MLSTESLILNPSEPTGHLPLDEEASAHVLADIAEREAKQKKREAHLKRELRKLGARYREDSRLCQQFVSGHGLPIDEIATKLKEMDYFVKQTNYCRIMGQLYTAHRNTCKDTDFITAKDYLSPIAKLHVLNRVHENDPFPRCTDEVCIVSRKGYGFAKTRHLQNGSFTTPFAAVAFPDDEQKTTAK